MHSSQQLSQSSHATPHVTAQLSLFLLVSYGTVHVSATVHTTFINPEKLAHKATVPYSILLETRSYREGVAELQKWEIYKIPSNNKSSERRGK